tara:strand:- start:11217 stop:11723 length:507 start_codon:yes stop_codon:yes gene_type:complete
MLNYIFFKNPISKGRLALTVSDKSVEDLKEEKVIPSDSPTLCIPYQEPAELDGELFLLIYNNDLAQFDNNDSPTKIEMNKTFAILKHLKDLRMARVGIMRVLDRISIRYLATDRKDILDEIEKDKQALRDFPEQYRETFESAETLTDLTNMVPHIFVIDYNEKYEGMA